MIEQLKLFRFFRIYKICKKKGISEGFGKEWLFILFMINL